VPTLADLDRAVRATLAAGRIGQPVFVRCHLAGLPGLSRARDLAAGWIGSRPVREHVLPSAVAVQFANGASAVVSESVHSHLPDIDLTVLGTRGAVYHPIEEGGSLDEEEVPASAKRQAVYGVLLVSGAHTHQELYAPAFAADPRCRLVAVTDEADVDPRRRALNERLAQSLGLPYIADLGAALARDDVHIVSVCAEPERRGRIIVRCAEAGKHLYLDKPLAPSLADADAIVAAMRKAGVRSQMFTFVTAPWAARARRLLRESRCGRLVAIHADTFFAKGHPSLTEVSPRREEYPPIRQQLSDAKREMDNIGVYPVSLVRWLTGREFRSVWATTGNYFFAEHRRRDVEDFGLIAATLDDGTVVTIACGRSGWQSHPGGGVNRVMLVGTDQNLVIDAARPRLEVSAAEPPWVPPPPHPEDPMAFWHGTQQEVGLRPKQARVPIAASAASDVSRFLDALDAGRDGEVNAAEAAQATAVLLDAYRSAAAGTDKCTPDAFAYTVLPRKFRKSC
jgi:predicted dehydrogenase